MKTLAPVPPFPPEGGPIVLNFSRWKDIAPLPPEPFKHVIAGNTNG